MAFTTVVTHTATKEPTEIRERERERERECTPTNYFVSGYAVCQFESECLSSVTVNSLIASYTAEDSNRSSRHMKGLENARNPSE